MAIKKFQDLQVEHPQRYEVTDNAGTENLKTIKFSPGKVYQEGTKETAVIFNNIQKNGLYTVIGTRAIEGTEEMYDVELEGLEEFGIFDINLQLVVNAKNTTNSPKLRLLNEKYSFVNNNGTISIGDLAANNIYIVKIDTVKKTAFLIESDKLQKGTYSGKASDLDNDKYDKTGGVIKGYPKVQIPGYSQYGMGTFSGIYENNDPSWLVGRNNEKARTILRNYNTNNKTSEIILEANAGNNILTGTNENGLETVFYNTLNFYPISSLENDSEVLPASAASSKKLFKFYKGNTGISTTVYYIQDNRTKYPGFIYLDRSVSPNVPYRCLTENNDVTPTSNFMPADNNNIARILNETRKETSYTLTSNSGNLNLIFIKIGRIVTVHITTTGDTINGELNNKILPESFKPSTNTFLGFPAINGSPYINIQTTGVLRSYDNGATMHTKTTTTQYNLTQSYIANEY